MPRIPTQLITKAYQQNPLLPLLLQECRSLDSARNELRWLHEHALCSTNKEIPKTTWKYLRSMCRRRSKGTPLQYLIGNQPFGDLEILCQKGVLIPRSETEYFTFRTAELALDIFARSGLSSKSSQSRLRILDVCAGTGCISLLLHALLSRSFSRVSILGIDISHEAVRLAERNIKHNLRLGLLSDRALSEIQFRQGDFLRQQDEIDTWIREAFSDCSSPSSTSHPRPNPHDQETKCDILISNPPYVSSLSYQDGTTSRSVRRYEPKVALVPPVGIHSPISERYAREDLFYHHILLLSFRLSTKLTVLECGDYAQAERVSALCRDFAAVEGLANEMDVGIWDSGEPDSDDVGFLGPQAVVVRRRGL